MSKWINICHLDDIPANTGRCALLNKEQIAIFHINDGEKRIYAVSNYCPFSEANIISRGIVGNLGDKTVVASPLYKQHFELTTGECLEDENVTIKIYPVRLDGDTVQLAA